MQRGQRLFGRPRIQRLAMSTGDPKHLLHPHPGLRPWLEGGAPAVTPVRLKSGSQGIRARPSGARPSSLSSPDQRPPRALCRQRPLSGIVGEGPRGSPGARREVRNPHEGSLVPLRVSDQRIENEDEEGRLRLRDAKSLPLVCSSISTCPGITRHSSTQGAPLTIPW